MPSDQNDHQSTRRIVIAGALSAVVQVPLTYFGAVFPMPNGLYGAPIPVGESSGPALFGGGPTFSVVLWLLNLAITTAVISVMPLSGGARATLWVGVWAVAALLIGYTMQLGVTTGVLPFAGFPIPASIGGLADGRPIHVVFLADALLFAGAYLWWRRRQLG